MVFDVAIVGGGLVGTSLALGLGRAGFHCALVEAGAPVGPRPDAWDSRIYAVSPASQSFLESIGVWQEIDVARLAPVYDMQVHGDRGGQLRFSAHASGADRLATIVEAATLQQALRRSLPAHRRLRVFCPDRPLAL